MPGGAKWCSNFCVTDTSPWIIRSDQGWTGGVTRPCPGEVSTLAQSELCKYLIHKRGSLTLGVVQLQLAVPVAVGARPLLSAGGDRPL